MLPRAHRLRRSAEFGAVLRRGARAGRPALVVHAWRRPEPGPVRIGLSVGRGVGNAVTRNQVKRRLRALAGERLADLPAQASLVLRANPAAAHASYAELGRDFESCLRRLRARGGGQ